MKKLSILVALCIAFIGCSSNNSQDPYITKEDIVIDKILNNYAMWVEKEYQIYPIGTAVGMPNGILRTMGVHFQSYKIMSKQEAREIVINSSQKLLSMINAEPLLQNCLITSPFEIKNIVMRIFISDAEGYDTVYDPNLGIIELHNGYLEYVILNESHEYVSEVEESYEEAVEALKNQP